MNKETLYTAIDSKGNPFVEIGIEEVGLSYTSYIRLCKKNNLRFLLGRKVHTSKESAALSAYYLAKAHEMLGVEFKLA